METVKPKSWLVRNWVWVMLAGLLGLVGSAAAICALVFGMMRSSEPCRMALERLRNNPEAVAALGDPIREGRWVSGRLEVHGDGGEADMTLPVSGPRGAGRLHLEAQGHEGRWTFSALSLSVDGGRRIELEPVKP